MPGSALGNYVSLIREYNNGEHSEVFLYIVFPSRLLSWLFVFVENMVYIYTVGLTRLSKVSRLLGLRWREIQLGSSAAACVLSTGLQLQFNFIFSD